MKGPILFFRSKPKQALGMKARLVRASPSAGSGPATSRPSFDRSNRKGQKKITTKAEEDEEGSSITTITTDSTCTSAFTANSPTFSMNMRDSKRFETSPSSSLSEDSFSVSSAVAASPTSASTSPSPTCLPNDCNKNDMDIYFGLPVHPGTRGFQMVVQSYYNELLSQQQKQQQEKQQILKQQEGENEKQSQRQTQIVFNPMIYQAIMERVPSTCHYFVREATSAPESVTAAATVDDDSTKHADVSATHNKPRPALASSASSWIDVTKDKRKLIRLVGESWRRAKFSSL